MMSHNAAAATGLATVPFSGGLALQVERTSLGPVVREATFADFDAIAELETNQGLVPRSREHRTAMWTANPVYRDIGLVWPLGWVLEEEQTGRLVGSLSNIPLPYMLHGEPVLAATAHACVVEPEYRGFGPRLFDEYLCQSADLLLSTATSGMAHTAAVQSRVPVGDWSHAAYAVTAYAGFAEAALRMRNAPAPAMLCGVAGPAMWLRDRLALAARANLRSRTNGITVTCGAGFDSGFDLFWAELQAVKKNKLMGVRTREVLEWHFAAAMRQDRLRVLSVEKNDRLLAYAILLAAEQRTSSGLKRMRIVDYQCLSDDRRIPEAILQRASSVCREAGFHALEIVGCDLPGYEVLQSRMPHKRALPSWSYYYHSNDPSLMRELASPAVWEPSSFDGDSSL
jgi:hypothetical protein